MIQEKSNFKQKLIRVSGNDTELLNKYLRSGWSVQTLSSYPGNSGQSTPGCYVVVSKEEQVMTNSSETITEEIASAPIETTTEEITSASIETRAEEIASSAIKDNSMYNEPFFHNTIRDCCIKIANEQKQKAIEKFCSLCEMWESKCDTTKCREYKVFFESLND